ncbi:zinc ribbon domain-containing protein [Amphibacillus jilinensis]|uniref:zinc ribbon domain-containing protein n=1 Tax=Amphibacillus jilinensis TaxID=1216008 RepID=UPI0003693FF5|nr:zinc ribbon domain-containing protein [Amphibacillus jilinensis]
MYCKKCGSKNEHKGKFCNKCGVSLTQMDKQQESEEITKKQSVQPKSPMSKRNKLIVGIVLSLALLFFISYQVLDNYYAEDAQIDRLIASIENRESSDFVKQLVTYDPSFEVTEESIAPYMDYLNNNKEYLSRLVERMRNSNDAFNSSHELYIEQEGSYFGLFDRYQLVINPVYLAIESSIDGAVIAINDEEAGIYYADELVSVGPVAPGRYQFSAAVDSDIPLENVKTEDVLSTADTYLVTIPLRSIHFSVTSDIEDATVYLDDVEIGVLSGGEGQFGPLPLNDNSLLQLKKAYESDTLASEPVHVTEYQDDYHILLELVNVELAQSTLNSLYQEVGYLISWGDSASGLSDIQALLVDGRDSSLYKTFTNTADRYNDDEEVRSVHYTANIQEFEQLDIYDYAVIYELDVETRHYFGSDQDDFTQTLTFEAIMVYDEEEQVLKLKSADLIEG